MGDGNGNGPVDTAAMAHHAAARRVAAALVTAFERCDEEGVGLTEVQKITLFETMLLQFEGFADHLRTLEGVGRLLRQLGQR